MMRKLREEAAAVGCDALLVSEPHDRIQGYSGQHQGQVNGAGYQGTSNYSASRVRSHRAICLMFTEEASATPAAPLQAPPPTDL